MATTKAYLDTLPEELILAIINHLDPNNLQSLNNLNQTNRRLHRLTLEQLYSTFPGRNSELFLRTVSQTPSLAQHVKAAVWHQERRLPTTRPPILNTEKHLIIQKLNELSIPHGTDLASQFAKFSRSDDYWYMEVLLLFMPHLTHLTIRDSWLWDDHHYWFKSLSPFFNPLCNSRLTTATLFGPLRIENAVPLLTIPTLRTLELSQVIVMRREGYRVFQWSVWPVERLLPARTSRLEALCMRESYIDLEILIPLFQSIRALKKFTYDHVPNDLAEQRGSVDPINTTALQRCLDLQHASLEHVRVRDTLAHDCIGILDILSPHRPDEQVLRTLDIGPFKVTWQQFLSVRAAAREFVDKLPPSLVTLRLKIDANEGNNWAHPDQGNYWMHKLVEFLPALAHAINDTHPVLREVALEDWPPTMGWFPDNLPTLQKMYNGLGLTLTSVAGEVGDFFEFDPLILDEDAEPGWVVIADITRLS